MSSYGCAMLKIQKPYAAVDRLALRAPADESRHLMATPPEMLAESLYQHVDGYGESMDL